MKKFLIVFLLLITLGTVTADTTTIETGDSETVNVGTNEHFIEVLSVSQNREAEMKVNGENLTKGEKDRIEVPGNNLVVSDVSIDGELDDGVGKVSVREKFDEELRGLSEITKLNNSNTRVVIPDLNGDKPAEEIGKQLSDDLGIQQIKDSDVTQFERGYNLILVGGPSVNSLTEELAFEDKAWSSDKYEVGDGRIKLVRGDLGEGKNAIVLGGYSSDDLRRVSNTLVDIYNGEKLEDKEGVDTLKSSSNAEVVEEYSIDYEKDSGEVKFTVETDPTTGERNFWIYPIEADVNFIAWRDKLDLAGNGEDTVSRELPPGKYRIEIHTIGNVEYLEGEKLDSKLIEIEEEDENDKQKEEEDQEEKDEEGEKTKQEFVMELRDGWNMISAPLLRDKSETQDSFEVSDLEDECEIEEFEGKKALKYDSGDWVEVEAVSAYEGVFVKSSENCRAKYKLEESENDKFENSKELQEGWNMISVPRSTSLEKVKGNCEFEKYDGSKVWHYDTVWNEWSKFNTTTRLNHINGYYVKTAENCELNVENEKPPTPTGSFLEGVGEVFR